MAELVYQGIPLEIKGGQVEPFVAKKANGMMLIKGVGTITLMYSANGVDWSADETTFTITGGSINIDTDFVPFCYYKVTCSGSIHEAYVKYY